MPAGLLPYRCLHRPPTSRLRPQLFAYQRQSITEKVGLDFFIITSVCSALAMIVAYPVFLIAWTKPSLERLSEN
jgi:hypothetical protein